MSEVDQLRQLAKSLSDALLKIRPLGGSEMFVHRCGAYYADPEYCGRMIDEMRADNMRLLKEKYRKTSLVPSETQKGDA